jgi:hypothetical protein
VDVRERAELFFFGKLPNMIHSNAFLIMAVLVFQYCVWEEKLRKKKPSFMTIDNNYCEIIFSLAKTNGKIFKAAEKLNLPLCRITGAYVTPTPPLPPWIQAQPIPWRLPRQP